MTSGYFWSGRDFPWTVPVVHVVLLVIPAVLLVLVSRLRPGLVSLRRASWLFATLAIWAALLRMPLYGACSLLLAAGLGRPISDAVVGLRPATRGVAGRSWRGSSACWSSWRPSRRVGRRSTNTAPWPDCRPRRRGARNVVLIVWDTVRASNLSLYGYPPRHHAQPGAVGPEGRPVQPRPGARPVDVPLA